MPPRKREDTLISNPPNKGFVAVREGAEGYDCWEGSTNSAYRLGSELTPAASSSPPEWTDLFSKQFLDYKAWEKPAAIPSNVVRLHVIQS
jgi:hypothetical protein